VDRAEKGDIYEKRSKAEKNSGGGYWRLSGKVTLSDLLLLALFPLAIRPADSFDFSPNFSVSYAAPIGLCKGPKFFNSIRIFPAVMAELRR